eukprot:3452-Heterococcus_DN1.PRE.1
MESLTPQEQSGFVRFAWGRSRLPSKAHWTTNMKLYYCTIHVDRCVALSLLHDINRSATVEH